ncbi:MAG: tRNA pseudouridine(55) synthase TruB [Suipraeoptans sp.]
MINGILNVKKEKDYTSHDVVAKLRGIVGQKKIGHTGTLDPNATGVLPVCLGKATKVCDLITDKDKTYKACALLGLITDTQDISGNVISRGDVSVIKEDDVVTAFEKYIGEYMQIPPMYSAVKINGKKLYEYAREGKEIERKSRKVLIYDLHVDKIDLPRVFFTVTCSKGTYIRTLCHDIGMDLTCGAVMEELERTQVMDFNLNDSVTLDEISEYVKADKLNDILLPVDYVFVKYPKGNIVEGKEQLAYNGNRLKKRDIITDESKLLEGNKIRIYDKNNDFVGIYIYKNQEYALVKMFYNLNGQMR